MGVEELRLRAKGDCEKELFGCSFFGDSFTASLRPFAMVLCMPGKGNMGLNRLLDMRLDIGIEEGGRGMPGALLGIGLGKPRGPETVLVAGGMMG